MASIADVESEISGMQQAIVIASAFFSQASYYRRVLPAICFCNVRIGKSVVKGVKIPCARYSSGLQKGIYSWLMDDLRVAISTMPRFTASMILHDEAYQIRVEKRAPSVSMAPIAEKELLKAVQNMMRSLELYIITDGSAAHNPRVPMLDIGEGVVDLTSAYNDAMEVDFFGMKAADDNKDGAPGLVRGLKRNISLCVVETASVVMEFIYCSS